ncbi:Polyketide cyclase / dehydrase and lipid transport family protein [Leishmania donovani]|uniref:Polyketide cyclase / dehydrase and lipid transport family protein n=1 Tax=Leishmania donovani TaxID=5661 RepID=A0A504XQ37_LEIDO|nr:Polyketide cyclase / dehydrase and lipid transport family protein [Leishmania donovani]TPP51132.1 Polyketide cyclase / dehydrase and lipid transport family protein [Leishmania donovani]
MRRLVSSTHASVCGGTGAEATSTCMAMMEVCDALYSGRRRRITLMPFSAAAATAMTAVAMPQRTFWSGPPGKDFLSHFVPSSKPTKVVSPLESLRPPAPPSASDARPFGSLNRTNSIRRYVNINAAEAAPSTADSEEEAASFESTASPSKATTAPAPPRMELSRLLHRYHSSSSTVSAPATTSSNELPGTRREEASLTASSASSTRPEAADGAAGSPTHGCKAATSQAYRASSSSSDSRHHVQVYREHCTIGWSPDEFYSVVADVEHYSAFLPWCAGSEVHTTRRVRVPRDARRLPPSPAAAASPLATGCEAAESELVDAIEMTTTLTIGFSFLKEQYTSRVTLYPGRKIVAALYDEEDVDVEAAPQNTSRASSAAAALSRDSNSALGTGSGDGFVLSFFRKAASTAGVAAKRSILRHLRCEWEFAPVEGKPNTVDVLFFVSFEFKNPMYRHLIMNNVVGLMTRSFERRCESLYGPPSATKVSLPVLS